ncbi:MAG: PAS domain S-box protein, partial [Nitrospirae bacterium]|nr:PAS domain S-box protein [Nitrospirota bacterium]
MTNKLNNITSANKYPYLLSLRVIITLTFVIMTILSLLTINYFERQRALKQIQENSIREITELSFYLQNILEHLLNDNRIDLVQKQIGLLGSNINLRLVLLVDENNDIIASTHRQWIGHKIGDFFTSLGGDEDRNLLSNMEDTRKNKKSVITKSSKNETMYAQYPVYSGISVETLHSLSVNVLFIDYDLSRQIEHSHRAILINSLNYSGFLISVYIISGFAIYMIVTRRLVKLTSVINRILSGDMSARTDISGNDEITNLSSCLNMMLDKILEVQSQLRALGDNLPNGMMYQVVREHDGSMRFLYISASVERLNGVSADDVLRDPSALYGQIMEEDIPAVAAAEELSANEMSSFNVEARFRRTDGQVRWMQLSSCPRLLSDGRILWDGIEIDITERKRIEKELVRSKDELLNILESISDGFFTLNWEWRYTYLNTNAGKMIKRDSKDLVGKIILQEFPEMVNTPYYQLYNQVMQTGIVKYFE